MKDRNINDENSYKTRRGKIKGYKDYLRQENLEYIDRMIADLSYPDILISSEQINKC